MDDSPASDGGTQKFEIGNSLRNIQIHENFSKKYVVVTRDRLELILLRYKKALLSGRGWICPLGVAATALVALLAGEFKEFLGLSGATWRAIFILGAAGALIWTIGVGVRGYRHRGQRDPGRIAAEVSGAEE